MSLPSNFSCPEEYFHESLHFFKEYQHLFNFPNTEILVQNVLQQISTDGIDEDDLFNREHDFPNAKLAEINDFLKEFYYKLDRLSVKYNDINEDIHLEIYTDVPLGPKKKHEIVNMVNELKEVCMESGSKIVVDFGSGLGYLDQLLHETTNLKVLGLECNEGHYVGAKKRQRKYHLDSVEHVKYIRHTVNEKSDKNIQDYLEDKFGIDAFCITGLHACADLSIDGANLFLKMADAKSMVLIPCCYHKMAPNAFGFKNFPLSKSLKRIYDEYCASEFLKVPFLRLATQPPNKDESLHDLVFNLLARATLELYANKHNCKLKRNKRKAVKTKTVNRNFSTYLQDGMKGFSAIPKNTPSVVSDTTEITFNIEELESIWRESENLTTEAAILILLQNSLQPVFENFILYDRLVYLQEKGIKNCYFKKIFNEKISPRCLALVSIK